MTAANEYWKLVMLDLQFVLPSTHYNTWFNQLSFVRTEKFGKTIVINTFSKFSQKYIESKYQSEFLACIKKYYPNIQSVVFTVDETAKTKPRKHRENLQNNNQTISFDSQPNQNNISQLINLDNNQDNKKPNSQTNQASNSKFGKLINSSLPSRNLNNLNPKYTFDNFVVTDNNELASSVAKIVSAQPGKQYNPVFLYGETGMGKTHLLQAIGQKTLENYPNFNIKYVTSESFVNQYIDAITTRKMKEFNEHYRSIDLLLVDDIQFIAGKEGTQETFFHIFNILHQHDKQIIVTCDKHPKNLGGMENRLISRFEWGIVIDISKPNAQDRLTVITDKVNRGDLQISPSQMEIIANTVDTNYRDIEGVLNRIGARQKLLPNKPFEDQELVTILKSFSVFGTVSVSLKTKITNSEQLLENIALHFGVSKSDITGSSRLKNISTARQLAMYIFKEDLGYSYSAIASLFSKNHSTIIYSVEKTANSLKTDSKAIDNLNQIRLI